MSVRQSPLTATKLAIHIKLTSPLIAVGYQTYTIMCFRIFIVTKGYRNSSEKAVSYFIIKLGGIIVLAKKIELDDKSLFFNLHIKGMRDFNAQSDVGLYVANIGYPLSLGVSLLLLILMVGLAVLPLSVPNTELARALVLINVGLLPVYLIGRYWLVRRRYGITGTLRCFVSQQRIAIPANAIINKPVGQLELQRGDIERITVKYKSQMHRLHVRNHITACDIKLKSGEVIILNAMYFPLKHIVYMLCFFDYPLTTLHGNWSWAFLPNIIAVIFPVLVNVVVTGMLVKHYFL